MGSDIGGDGLRRWLLVTGNRRAVTGFLVVSLYVAMFPLSMFDQAGVNPIFGERSSVAALLNTLLSGVILLVSVVVSIASLFTSQELSAVSASASTLPTSSATRRRRYSTAKSAPSGRARSSERLRRRSSSGHRRSATVSTATSTSSRSMRTPTDYRRASTSTSTASPTTPNG